jgi:hypothetical protein
MTTIAMSAGMIPAALAFGDGGEFRAPMAIAVIGGLLVSTALSLVFVPSFYSIMDDVSLWTGRFFTWLLRPNKPDEPQAETGHADLPALASLPASVPLARRQRRKDDDIDGLPEAAE